jgi:hypothetical protein
LDGLLGTVDQIATRRPTPAVTLEIGLEQARGAILRNLGGDALAALDNVWEGARRTEEGWYLRSGALTLLGLPGESDRVADEGLLSRPDSLALRFLQSVARLAVGDIPGARAALTQASGDAPSDPLLVVQHAIVLARQGDAAGADVLLQRIARYSPDHPALDYGRAAVRLAVTDATRQTWRATPASIEVLFAADTPVAADRAQEVEVQSTRSADVVDAAMQKLGARLASGASSDVAREVRVLVRAFSAGGTMVTMGSAEQAHAARVLLTTLLGVFTGDATDAPAPLRALLQQLASCVREGRASDAERLARKANAVVREPLVRLLQSLVRGAVDELTQRGRASDRASVPTPASTGIVIHGQADPGAVVPVRLGLALLGETPASRAAARALAQQANGGVPLPDAPSIDAYDRVYIPGLEATGRHLRITPHDGSLDVYGFPIHDATVDPSTGLPWNATHGWAATAVVHEPTGGAPEPVAGTAVRLAAVLCVVAAAAAVATGHSALAVALGAGAAWMAVRLSGGDAAHRPSERPSVTDLHSPDRTDHQADQRR